MNLIIYFDNLFLDSRKFIKPVALASAVSKRLNLPNSLKGDKRRPYAAPSGETNFDFDREEGDSSGESSILDVNNDEIFDDSVFTSYDEKNISTMTKKMSKHWRKKFKEEDRQNERKLKDKLSIEQLVEQQIEKDKIKQQSIKKGDKSADKDKNVTDNRRRRTKPGYGANNQDLDLHCSGIGRNESRI